MREEKIPRNNVLITTLASNKNTHHLPCFCNNIIQNERIIKRSTMRLKFNLLIGTLLCFKFTSGNVVECPDPNAAPVEVDGKCTLISFVSNVFYRRFLASSDSRTFIVLFYFILFCFACLVCLAFIYIYGIIYSERHYHKTQTQSDHQTIATEHILQPLSCRTQGWSFSNRLLQNR